MFMWCASIFRVGFNFKMLYLATNAFDIPLCCCLNKNCLFRLDSWIMISLLRLCPCPRCEFCQLAILRALSRSRNRCRQHLQSKFWSYSSSSCSHEQDYWFESNAWPPSMPPYSKYWLYWKQIIMIFREYSYTIKLPFCQSSNLKVANFRILLFYFFLWFSTRKKSRMLPIIKATIKERIYSAFIFR